MTVQENVQIVKDAFAAIGRGDMQGLLALSAEDIEWIIPGENWPLAGARLRDGCGLQDLTHRAHPKQFAKTANMLNRKQKGDRFISRDVTVRFWSIVTNGEETHQRQAD